MTVAERRKREDDPVEKSVCHHRKKLIFFLLALFCLSPAFPAQAAPPDSGTAIEGVKPPVVGPPPVKIPALTVEGNDPPVSADSQQKIMVSAFRIGGESPLPAEELLSLVKGEAGKEITLGDINRLAGRITQHLRQKGYLVAFAYIPAQEVKDGIVEIAVIPGRYGQIRVSGTARIDSDRLLAMLTCAKPGMLITRGPLERALLLVSDLPGVSVKATLAPGETAGTADLLLETADTAKMSGIVYIDNWGNRYTGETRHGVQLTVNNLSGNGDAFNLGGLTTFDGVDDFNFGYSSLLGHNGTKFEIRRSRVSYTLGEEYAALGATGRATVLSYAVSHPFIRGRALNLYGTLGYDSKRLTDDIADLGSYSPRASKLWHLGLSGNFADSWLGGGMNAFSLIHYLGNLRTDDVIAQTGGDFTKTLLAFQRQQHVAENLNFNFIFTGQLADKNLDSSEKLFLGGGDGVRAFPQGEASGDQGYKVTGELRWRLPGLSGGANNLYLNAFWDYGSVMTNKAPWSGAGVNRRSLMGVGLGLLWTRDQDFAVRMDYAWKIGDGQVQTPDERDKNGRLWLQGVKYF